MVYLVGNAIRYTSFFEHKQMQPYRLEPRQVASVCLRRHGLKPYHKYITLRFDVPAKKSSLSVSGRVGN